MNNINLERGLKGNSIKLLYSFFVSGALILLAFGVVGCKNQEDAYSSGEMAVSKRESGEVLLSRLQNKLAVATGVNSGGVGETLYAKIKVSATLESLQYNPPTQWVAGESAGVRFATFQTVAGNEVSMVSFSGDVGGLTANVQRWLGQMEASPQAEEAANFLAGLQERKTKTGLPYIYLNLTPFSREKTILVGIFRFSQQTLFVKLLSETNLLGAEEKLFINFLQTFGSQ